MNYFSKKTWISFLTVSLILLALSSVLVLFSNQLLQIAYDFLSQKIFHREFSLEKWQASIESFFLVPAFGVLLINTIFFVKYPPKAKVIFLAVFIGIISFMILYTNFVATRMHANADLGSELMLGRECVLEKSFWPRGWCYSTEIRLFNTQFFSALGFLFTDNFDAVKTIQSFFTCGVLFFVCWYSLNQLEIKSFWLKFLLSTLSFLPWSVTVWHVGAGENYYIPHAIFGLVYVATFIKLTTKTELKHKRALTIFFFAWAFTCGLSSIRYIIVSVLPLCFAVLFIETRDKSNPSVTDFKKFWLENKSVFYSVLGVFLSGFGYIANNLVLQKIYYFSEWNSMSFNGFGETKFMDCFYGLLDMFGFQQNIAVFTPGGIINVLVYLSFVLFALYMFISLKNGLPKSNKIQMSFFISTMILNTFLYMKVDYISRYYYPLVMHVIPCLGCIISNGKLSDARKYCLGTVWSFLLTMSSYATISNRLNVDENTRLYNAANFLVDNGYHFGYATFGNSTNFTYITNGKIEVGNLLKAKSEGNNPAITQTYKYDTWLTPKRYYEKDFAKGEKVFMALTYGQFQDSKDFNIVKNGKLVFIDGNFAILEYESHDVFRNSF